jgi:hypothetical protein
MNGNQAILLFLLFLALFFLILILCESGKRGFGIDSITLQLTFENAVRFNRAYRASRNNAYLMRSHLQHGTDIQKQLQENNLIIASYLVGEKNEVATLIADKLTMKITDLTASKILLNSEIATLVTGQSDTLSYRDLMYSLERDDSIYEEALKASDLNTKDYLEDYNGKIFTEIRGSKMIVS